MQSAVARILAARRNASSPGSERVVDDREAQRLLADAEDVGQPDGREPQDGAPASIGLSQSATGSLSGEPAREQDRAHVEHGDESAGGPDEDEPQDLRREVRRLMASTRNSGGRSKTTLATT